MLNLLDVNICHSTEWIGGGKCQMVDADERKNEVLRYEIRGKFVPQKARLPFPFKSVALQF